MAAGLGFKTFTTGEVLTAADTNGYLMQGILVFASEAARNSAITSPQEGQFAFTKDTNSTWYYDGAAWVASGASGDVTGVTAGTGITVASPTGPVPVVTNDMATTITASGDIVVGTGSGTYDNLPIGTTGQILTADTTVSPYKVKWATAGASAQDFQLINAGGTALTGAATITVNVSGKNQLAIFVSAGSSTSASSEFIIRFNADSGGNYRYSGYNVVTTTLALLNEFADSSFKFSKTGNTASNAVTGYLFASGTNATGIKPVSYSSYHDGSAGNAIVANGNYIGTSAITSVSIISNTGNFDAGTIYVYGA